VDNSPPAGRRVLPFAPVVLAVVAATALLVVPTGREESVWTGSGGEPVRRSRSTTLVQSEGWDVLVVLAVPVVLAGAPLFLRRSRWRRAALKAASGLLLVGVVISAASIGLFFLPATAAMFLAAAMDPGRG
jgi:hypothetical protein